MRVTFVALLALVAVARAEDFETLARRLRQAELLRVFGPPIMAPAPSQLSRPVYPMIAGRYPWKLQITATCFWAGESRESGGGIDNYRSAWDPNWLADAPYENPYYVALPYNDVADDHTTKPEARSVIPWFSTCFVKEGQSVCKGRWVELRRGNKVCYAQWADVGPFQTDHWQYVFGNERPRPNRNRDAGIDVSPAVRDYLHLGGMDALDWKFTDRPAPGPWLSSRGARPEQQLNARIISPLHPL